MGPHGVRVNTLAPGFILTSLTKKLWSDSNMKNWGKVITPLRCMGRVEDLIGTAIFLGSEAFSYHAGQMRI